MKKQKTIFVIALLLMSSILSGINFLTTAQTNPDAPTLDPNTIPKFVDQLVIPPVYVPENEGEDDADEYEVDMTEFYQQILPTQDAHGNPTGFGQTKVWGYAGVARDAITGENLGYVQHSPSCTFETQKGRPVQVTWVNKITTPSLFPVDPTLHWANPNNIPMDMLMPPFTTFPPGYAQAQSPVPLSTHLHGAVVHSDSDGGPEQWFTATGVHGPDYTTTEPTDANSAVYYYANDQEPTTLFYHDHALGMTRLNVASGLAGFWMIRDPSDPVASVIPNGKYDVPIAIQDRSFNTDGSMWFPTVGVNPDIHPYWNPEFFGNTIMVNGKLWPNLNVDRGQYFFRLLDGSNARFYNISLKVIGAGVDDAYLSFKQIMTDGSYLQSPVKLKSLVIAPGERAGILVDFAKCAPGMKVIMTNDANAPFPDGDPVDENTAVIMQFTVGGEAGFRQTKTLPRTLTDTLMGQYPTLVADSPSRILPFFEQMSAIDEPVGVFLNGQKWSGVLTETPRIGATEDWFLVNPTEDAHPIHTHLTQFQILYRVPFDAVAYTEDWMALNGEVPLPEDVVPQTLPVEAYITGPREAPAANEKGWKDTIQSPPGYITVIRIRWAPQDAAVTGANAPSPGVNLYPFDPTTGPGYVWHCHIIDHEDNEMMRRYKVIS